MVKFPTCKICVPVLWSLGFTQASLQLEAFGHQPICQANDIFHSNVVNDPNEMKCLLGVDLNNVV